MKKNKKPVKNSNW